MEEIKPAQPRVTVPEKPKREYATSGRERMLLFLAWGLGILAASLMFACTFGWPGLGVTVLTAVWYAVLLCYVRPKGFWKLESLLLFLPIAVLAIYFTVYSNQWFRFFNGGALLLLLALHAVQLTGVARLSWTRWTALVERLWLAAKGLLEHLVAPFYALKSFKAANNKRLVSGLLGAGIALLLFMLIVPVLATADGFFAMVTGQWLRFFKGLLGDAVARAVLGLLLLPLFYSFLYALAHPTPLNEGALTGEYGGKLDPVVPLVVLGALDVLYALFVGVQWAALYGGAEYVERVSGLTYADYARNGFFQLVFVAALNLTFVLLAVVLARREGKWWQGVRVLSTLMLVLSGAMLASAAQRMTLYVGVYGLSFKRALTYWGMAVILLLLVLAAVKIWRRDFSFVKLAAGVAVAGWLVLNLVNVDAIVTNYNVELYLRQTAAAETPSIDLEYLAGSLSYAALPALERLEPTTTVQVVWREDGRYTLGELIELRRTAAARECAQWETWSLSAWLAAVS